MDNTRTSTIIDLLSNTKPYINVSTKEIRYMNGYELHAQDILARLEYGTVQWTHPHKLYPTSVWKEIEDTPVLRLLYEKKAK